MRYFLSFFVLLFILSGCKKDSGSDFKNPYKDSCDQIVNFRFPQGMYGTGYAPSSVAMTYDSRGRVSSLTFYPYQPTYRYTYYTDSIVISNDTSVAAAVSLFTLYLNKHGYITSIARFPVGYSYDDAGYMNHYFQYDPTGNGYRTYDLIYKDGNLVTWTNEDSAIVQERINFTYFDKPSQDLLGENSPLYPTMSIPDFTFRVLITAGFFGKPSKSLLHTSSLNDYPVTEEDLNTYDSKGRIIRIGPVSSNSRYFQYKCE